MNKAISLLLPLLLCVSCIAYHPVQNVSVLSPEGEPIPTLVGRASATTWLWLWTTGDASVEKAQENGGIKEVSSISRTTNSFLGFIVREDTIVRGN
ncbi:MAG: TRL-like family protein [Akkermansia sp.]|nr:TRL-like family protein [Akkermansia sp.]MBR6575957.1 TRL-like family protein [Akkermansia sp.]